MMSSHEMKASAVPTHDEDEEYVDDNDGEPKQGNNINATAELEDNSNNDDGLFKGSVQAPAYRDVPFAILFFIHLFGITGTAMIYGSAFLKQQQPQGVTDAAAAAVAEEINDDYEEEGDSLAGSTALLIITGMFLAAAACTTAALRLMMAYPSQVVHVAFFAAPLTFGLVALFLTAMSDSENLAAYQYLWTVAAIGAAISICWYKCLARYIPFAATTLRTALTAIRGQFGLYFMQVALLLVLYAYTILWLFAIMGVAYHDQQKGQVPCSQLYPNNEDNTQMANQMCDAHPMSPVTIGLFLLCLYWTQQVVQNVVHTTTSGVVGSWWFSPALGDPSCCGRQITDSLARATTYSFGSICFGSLLVSLVQALESLSKRRRNDIVTMIVQCLLICLRSWLEYFNSWAFCYVGLYGYDYLTAGKNVIQLFRERGWTTFIADRLVFRVLLLANLGVAAMTGAMCMVGAMVELAMTQGGTADPALLQGIFWIGFFIGLYVSNTVLFVVESATRCTMVLFAESASELATHHGELYQDLQNGWATSYPDAWERTTVATATSVV